MIRSKMSIPLTNLVATRSVLRRVSRLTGVALVLLLITACGFPRPPDVGDDAGGSDGSGTGDGSSGTGIVELALLAGDIGGAGNADGIGTTARFANPTGVAVDSSGTVYVADFNNGAIRKITSAGVVTTLASQAAGFELPQGVGVDGSGNVY